MIILKWYAIIISVLGILMAMYDLAKNQKKTSFIAVIIVQMPIIIYLILS